jgi:PhnB protein
MSDTVRPIPEGFSTLSTYLVVENAGEAIDFYTRALGAKERYRMPGPDDKIMHAELQIGDCVLMLSDEHPEQDALSPKALGGSPVSLFLYTEDMDSAFQQAVDAGAEVVMPPTLMFWGDRYGKFKDPFGHIWQIATHVEDVSPEEMMKRAQEAFAQEG